MIKEKEGRHYILGLLGILGATYKQQVDLIKSEHLMLRIKFHKTQKVKRCLFFPYSIINKVTVFVPLRAVTMLEK